MESPAVRSYISRKAGEGEPSDIAGRGLFAHEAIRDGEVVAIKGGHIVASSTLAAPDMLQDSEIQVADAFHRVASPSHMSRAWGRTSANAAAQSA